MAQLLLYYLIVFYLFYTSFDKLLANDRGGKNSLNELFMMKFTDVVRLSYYTVLAHAHKCIINYTHIMALYYSIHLPYHDAVHLPILLCVGTHMHHIL